MKKKILFTIMFLSLIVAMQFLCTNSVDAVSEEKIYNEYISYIILDDGTINVKRNYNNGNFDNATELKIPAMIEGKKVTSIMGFSGSKILEKVTLPDGIKRISMSTFANCTALKSINLPDTITEIGDCAFEGCTSLKSIVLPKNLKILEGAVFHNCTSLTEVTLPEGLETIDFYVETLMYRGYGAFEGCTSLKSIKLPNSLKVLTHAAFEDTGFTTINLPDSITNINTCLFYGCDNFTTFKMSNSITSVEQYAFGGCPNLRELYFSKNITKIDDKIFNLASEKYSVKPKGETDLSKLTIYGYVGTVAETLAKEKGIKFVVLKDEPTFKDVKKTDWYYNATEYCSSNGIITGYDEGIFAPNDKLSRGMLVTILYKMEGQPNVTEISKFQDVKNTKDYYYKAVIWAANKGVVKGYDDEKFGAKDYITREDLAVILNRYAKYKGKNIAQTNNLSEFKDANKTSRYAIESMKWAVGAGVITGNKDRTLNPRGQSSRAEAAAMIEKYCKNIGR